MLYIPGKPSVKEPKDEFIRLIDQDFAINLDERIMLVADVNHFKFMEDEFVWNQARERIPNYYEVYFDGVWVCDFMDNEKLPAIRLKFLRGFLEKYEAGEIHLRTKDEIEEEEVESAIDKAIRKNKNKKIDSEEDFIVQQAVGDLLEAKKNPSLVSKKKKNESKKS